MSSRAGLALGFALLLGVMLAHELEHVVQILQQDALNETCPNDCRGLLGFIFDVEPVHFAYNTAIFAILVAVVLRFRLWRSGWLVAGVLVQGYHVVEHVAKLDQWLANGHRSPTPGILGKQFNLVELHFSINTIVFVLVAAGFFSLGFHRLLWQLRSPRRLAVAGAVGAVVLAGTALGWSQRPPTVRLMAGIHEGPLVLDSPQRLVGEQGAVVRGGITVTADDVVVRDVTVLAEENGIEVDGAENVVLERVRVSGASLDGIHVRRGSVTIRDCLIHSPAGEYAQGIDISFSIDLAPSLVEGCLIVGGFEGIVTHSALVTIRENYVRDTSLRGIAITEMSMGTAEKNQVHDALGVGIYCGDYSHCMIDGNSVVGTRPDLASSNGTRMGYGILAVFGAQASLRANELTENHRRTRAFADAMIHRLD
jgi:hypothetical protein